MPNNGRITLCPYYRDEKNLSISCEDVFRRFRWKKQKTNWMDTYCDADWKKCPHAQQLNLMYEEREVQMSEKEKRIVELEHENQQLKKELKKQASMLGRSEKREKAKEEDIKKLRSKNRYLEGKYMEYAGKVRQYEAHEKRLYDELTDIAAMYEARFAYLMCKDGSGTFSEDEFDAWSKGKEFKLEYDSEKRIYKAVVREETKDSGKEYKGEEKEVGQLDDHPDTCAAGKN